MARSFRLPDLGEGIHEGEVLAIIVSVGDEVKEGDPILEVETDKAAVEIPSPYTGTVREILIKEGDIINVGDVLMTFSNGEEEEAVEREKPVEKPAEPAEVMEPKPAQARAEGPVPASPATRRLARELGVDLRQVTPTGPGGLVSADDVRAFAEEGEKVVKVPEAPGGRPLEAAPLAFPVPGLPDFAKWGPVERVPVRSIRRATAKQMTLAWSQIPHVHNQEWVDMTKLEAFRKNHKAEIEEKGGKLTHTVFAMKAVATALKTYPKFNATLDTEAGELVIKHYFHIGVAVNTDDGLIVPVIKDVDRKSIVELSIELNDLVQRTRERKASLEEMQGSTFTITNVGPMGGGFFAPIINYPEVAILGMGSTSMQAVVKEKEENEYDIVPRLMMPIVLCIDHRVLDGADALLFIRVLKEALEDPEELLITMI